jgi:DNA-binding NarL/FixJ family response regulator
MRDGEIAETRLRVLIADDNETIRKGIRSILTSRSDLEVSGEAVNGKEAVDKSSELRPDLVILDLSMPAGGLKLVKQIRKLLPEVPILLLSMYEGRELTEAARSAGVRGFVRKDEAGALLLKAVETVLHGQTFFPA